MKNLARIRFESLRTSGTKNNRSVVAIVQSLSRTHGAGRMSREILTRVATHTDLAVLTETLSRADILPQQELEPRTTVHSFVRNCMKARAAAQRASVVHALDAWPYGVYGLCAVLGTTKRLIISGIGTYSVAPLYNKKSSFLIRRAYMRANAIPCISTYTEDRIRAILPHARTERVLLGAKNLPIATSEHVSALRARLSIPENAFPVIITVGQIKDRKGQCDTLQGLMLLQKKYPNFLYMIVGDDQDISYVSSLRGLADAAGISSHIRIVSDIQSDTELSAAYQISHVQSLMSNNEQDHFEGFGLVLLEGAQFGIPAIGSRGCGIEDAIHDGVSGILVSQRDHEGIADALVRILDNYEAFQRGSREWRATFSWDTCAESIVKLYEYRH